MESIWTLRRSPDAPLAGLCLAIARRHSVDPVLVRIVVAILALSGGLGLVLYAAGWLLLPLEGNDVAPLFRAVPRAANVSHRAWLITVAVIAVLFSGWWGHAFPVGIGPALVLAAIWYFGFHRREARQQVPQRDAASESPEFQQAAAAWQSRLEAARAVPVDPGAALPEEQPLPYRPPQRHAPAVRTLRNLTLVVVAVDLLALAFVNATVAHVPAAVFFASALLIVAVSLVVAAWVGRPRGLLALGVLLAVATLAVGLPSMNMHRTQVLGHGVLSYNAVSDLPQSVNHGVGDLVVDLSSAQVTENRTMVVSTGVGNVELTLPPQGNVRVEWAIGAGSCATPDGSRSGTGLNGAYERISNPTQPQLVIQVSLGAGDLVLQ